MKWEAYRPILHSLGRHLPAAQEQDRCTIMLLRDQATTRIRNACPEAHEILAGIERLGVLNALATMTDEQACKLSCAMIWMMEIARDVQDVFKQPEEQA